MQCVANYEIKSELSVVSDDQHLIIQHPKGLFRARISNILRKDYSTPFLLSLQIRFEAPNLLDSRDIADERMVECLNMLAFTTGGSFRHHRIRQIVDGTPTSGMRDCLIWADSVGDEDPQPFLREELAKSIERLLQSDPPVAVRRALRWYRIGIDAPVPEEQFQYFWFALEILAEHEKSPEKVADKCPNCQSALYCESCKTHPTHRPYAKQAIRALIQRVDNTCDEETWAALDKARNALMHGATWEEIEEELPKSGTDIVDVLGKILFIALIHQFPAEIFDGKILVGTPSTYIQRTLTGIVQAQTVFSADDDGDLDLRSSGLNVSMVTDGPPQSGRPSFLVMTPEQHQRVGILSREKGNHQDVCRRMYQNVRTHEGKIVARVLATDMAQIRAAIQGSGAGAWPELMREILTSNQSPPP